jgi:hypothetical protein
MRVDDVMLMTNAPAKISTKTSKGDAAGRVGKHLDKTAFRFNEQLKL